jgi:alkanesulfonate monooxygenase
MPVEIIGMITTQHQSEIHPSRPPVVDLDYTRRFAQAHEAAGFDRILVPLHSNGPDPQQVIAHVASHTERVKFLLAHRPGFVQPTVAARAIATLENFTQGRLAVHIISGGSDEEQRRDGDFLDHDERYARTDEYLEILRRVWTSDRPFDHHGRFYRVEKAHSEVKPLQTPHLPV